MLLHVWTELTFIQQLYGSIHICGLGTQNSSHHIRKTRIWFRNCRFFKCQFATWDWEAWYLWQDVSVYPSIWFHGTPWHLKNFGNSVKWIIDSYISAQWQCWVSQWVSLVAGCRGGGALFPVLPSVYYAAIDWLWHHLFTHYPTYPVCWEKHYFLLCSTQLLCTCLMLKAAIRSRAVK